MMGSFSKRYGYGPCANSLIFENAPEKLRIGLFNLIQDYVREEKLPNFKELYLKITTHFKLDRSSYIMNTNQEESEIKAIVLTKFSWNEVFDLIEYLYSIVVYTEWDDFLGSYVIIDSEIKKARYNYTIDINNLLSSENIGWELKKGKLERRFHEYINEEVISKTKKILEHPNFAGPNIQFNKAIEYYNKRPSPDLENCVKEAVSAVEGLARILLNNPKLTLGDATNKIIKLGKIRKPLDKIFHGLYGFASEMPGTRHGATKIPNMKIEEAEFILYCSAASMIFLCKIFNPLQVDKIENEKE
ncbi:MAG: AbiJ-NTD4 domain-containing protein [Promethearchaeota archaeon]